MFDVNKITGVDVITTPVGMDMIVVHTTLPGATNIPGDDHLALTVWAERGKGADYVREHIGIEPLVRDNIE